MSDRIAIVGGGVIGCAIARALAPDFEVELFEQEQIASGATALAAGEVVMRTSYPEQPAIGRHAIEFFRSYDGTGEFTFTELASAGIVTPDTKGQKRRYADRLSSNGLPVTYLDTSEAIERYPTFELSELAGLLVLEETGFVDPYTLTVTLCDDAIERGVTVQTQTPVEEILTERGEVVGIEIADERVEVDHVIVATGWRTRAFLKEHVEIPVRPYRTQCVVLRPETPLPESFPMGWYPGEHVYFRPEHNGDLLVGGWSFAEDDPGRASPDADEAFRQHVADLLPTFLDGFDDARYVDGWAGIDGATPDTRPIIDQPADAPDGLTVATGFHGRGVMTAPVAATAVRSLLSQNDAPFSLEPFTIDRFDTRSDEFEFTSISDGTTISK